MTDTFVRLSGSRGDLEGLVRLGALPSGWILKDVNNEVWIECPHPGAGLVPIINLLGVSISCKDASSRMK